jgi:hypothetical protein
MRFSMVAAHVAACLLTPLLSACAGAGDPAVALRLQLHTVDDWLQPEQLGQRVSQATGMPVAGDVAAMAPHWYALTLQCPDRTSCKRAAMQLAARHALVVELRADETKRRPAEPAAETRQ